MRNPAVPFALLIVVAGATLALALWHPFSPSAPAASLEVADGDPVRGRAVFAASCAGCHGSDARGGVGPSLTGSLDAAKVLVVVQSGQGVMPADIVRGRDLADVAAFVASLSE
jgi:mono/diheme cytochrome c family protein